ncbi:MAG: hypothetical protein LBI85_04005, partial [Spirochaetaceae bacterium]|jgi:hypothetical protein|nr:hypothetical protein [Spirochaetaceae bacterium]
MGIAAGLWRYRELKNSESAAERLLARQREEMIRDRQEKTAYIQQLRETYRQNNQTAIPSAFDVCRAVLSSVDNRTKIENFSLAGYDFQFDARGVDAIALLSRFERNEAVAAIRLNRAVMDGGIDTFSFIGTVKPILAFPGEDSPLEEQIGFYEKENSRFLEVKEIKASRPPSAYSQEIMKLLTGKNCAVQSIQYYVSEYGLEIDYTVRAASAGFFNFLQAASGEALRLDIASLRVRSFFDSGSLSAVLRFRTGIPLAGEGGAYLSSPFEITGLTPGEMSVYFDMPRPPPPPLPPPPAAEPEEAEEVPPPPEPAMMRSPSFLSFIGTAGSPDGTSYALVKDSRSGRVLKIPFDPSRDNYVRYGEGGSLEITLDGARYEVSR